MQTPQSPRSDAYIVTIVTKPAQEITIADVIFGSLGIAGVLLLLALALGGLLSVVMVYWRRRHRPEDQHLPAVAPLIPVGNRRSTQAR